jgi:hypothetical protein
MKLLALLAANLRVVALYAAALLGNPLLFWWFELVPLSFVALAGLLWHRRLERELIAESISSIRAGAADDDNPALRS